MKTARATFTVAWLAVVLFVMVASRIAFGQTYTGVTSAQQQFFTAAGAVCNACIVRTYTAGTTTLTATYSNSTGTSQGSAVTLSASGGGTFYVSSAACIKLRLYSAADVLIREQDNICPYASASGVTGSIVGTTATQTLTNKTIGDTNTITVKDSLFTLEDNTTTTKKLMFELSGITAATTRTLTVPDANTTIVGTTATQTLTAKTLTSPAITTDIRATTAGAPTVGTTALPFDAIFLGTAATNNVKIDPAATVAAVVATIDDPGIAAVKLPLVMRGNATFTAAAIGANACGTDVTATVTGLSTTSVLALSLAAAPDGNTDNGLTWYFWPTANTVNIRVCNPTAGSLTPSADLTFRYMAVLP
jgi:hypothetical protein